MRPFWRIGIFTLQPFITMFQNKNLISFWSEGVFSGLVCTTGEWGPNFCQGALAAPENPPLCVADGLKFVIMNFRHICSARCGLPGAGYTCLVIYLAITFILAAAGDVAEYKDAHCRYMSKCTTVATVSNRPRLSEPKPPTAFGPDSPR